LVRITARVAQKSIGREYVDGPLGVRGRNSNNDLIREKLDWDYTMTLEDGIRKTYNWINPLVCADKIAGEEEPKTESKKLNPISRFLQWMDN
jgi:hypothetical protein